jgi:hypothetical protein
MVIVVFIFPYSSNLFWRFFETDRLEAIHLRLSLLQRVEVRRQISKAPLPGLLVSLPGSLGSFGPLPDSLDLHLDLLGPEMATFNCQDPSEHWPSWPLRRRVGSGMMTTKKTGNLLQTRLDVGV